MPSESMKAQKVYVGIQSSAGVAAAAFKEVKNVGIALGVRGQVDVFEPSNSRIPADVDTSAEWSEAALDGRVFFNSVLYFLASAFGPATRTQDGVTTAWKHVWTVRADHAAVRKLLTVQKGSTHKQQSLDNFVNQLTFAVERQGAYTFTGRMIGQPMTTLGAFGSSSTLTNSRALPRLTGLYYSDSLANLQTALGAVPQVNVGTIWGGGKVFSADFTTADMSHAKWVLNPNTTSWDDYIEDSITPTITTTVEANAQAMDEADASSNSNVGSFMYALRNAKTRYMALKTLSPSVIGSSTWKHMFLVEAAVQASAENLDETDAQGAKAYPFRWQVIDDGAFAMRFTVVTDVNDANLA
jgi:hypothetical protein